MLYGICNLSIVPLRLEPKNTSEMISQVLFGEHFKVLEKQNDWSKIQLHFDNYEGYIDNKQFEEIPEDLYNTISLEKNYLSGELIDFVVDSNNQLTTIPIGSSLPFFKDNQFTINTSTYSYEGTTYSSQLPKSHVIHKAFMFLNSPYLWGGKTPFGIDCSGFTQTVYKLCGYKLLRDAKDQATQGEVLSFIEESEAGDLAFFDDDEGIINHVGIVLNNYNIIHVHGKVRIDILDHSGIYNTDLQKHTHKLRIIKKIL